MLRDTQTSSISNADLAASTETVMTIRRDGETQDGHLAGLILTHTAAPELETLTRYAATFCLCRDSERGGGGGGRGL